MKKTISIILAAGFIFTSTQIALADPILGNWKTEGGETAAFAKCGSSVCITLKTGEHAGKRIGKLKASGNSYDGTITDPADNKEYTGSAKVSGSNLKLKGCALKVFCRTQNWKKL